jgi:hypothetical protein
MLVKNAILKCLNTAYNHWLLMYFYGSFLPMLKRLTILLVFAFKFLELSAQDLYDYNKVLIPLLDKRCYGCHNTNKEKGGVNLENYKEKTG